MELRRNYAKAHRFIENGDHLYSTQQAILFVT